MFTCTHSKLMFMWNMDQLWEHGCWFVFKKKSIATPVTKSVFSWFTAMSSETKVQPGDPWKIRWVFTVALGFHRWVKKIATIINVEALKYGPVVSTPSFTVWNHSIQSCLFYPMAILDELVSFDTWTPSRWCENTLACNLRAMFPHLPRCMWAIWHMPQPKNP